MMNIRVLIADDERPAREYLKSLLSAVENVRLVGEATDGAEALEMIKETKPDLALLDLQMPGLSGLEVVRILRRSQMPLVAFVTAYDEFAVKAFELNAVDYLLKPVEIERLRETIRRSADRLEREDWRGEEADKLDRVSEAVVEMDSTGTIERIPVRHRDEFHLIPVAEVASIIADGELLHITTGKNQKYIINHRLKDLESRLAENLFVRLSRGALVNLDLIASISPLPGGTLQVTLKNGQELTSSRLQSKVLRARLLKL